MKKFILLFIGVLVFYACLNQDDNTQDFTYKYLPIDSAITPASFTFGEIDTVKVTYSLPNGCYSFDRIYYERKDSTRTIAVTAFVDLQNSVCTTAIVQEEKKIPIKATQHEDYVLKFYKGKDSDGKNIFEEVIVPVN